MTTRHISRQLLGAYFVIYGVISMHDEERWGVAYPVHIVDVPGDPWEVQQSGTLRTTAPICLYASAEPR